MALCRRLINRAPHFADKHASVEHRDRRLRKTAGNSGYLRNTAAMIAFDARSGNFTLKYLYSGRFSEAPADFRVNICQRHP